MWDGLRSKPGRIPHDEVEAAPGENIGEVTLILKPGNLIFAQQSPMCVTQSLKVTTQYLEAAAQLSVETPLLTEEIVSSTLLQAVLNCQLASALGLRE